jgi:hypothetical protein
LALREARWKAWKAWASAKVACDQGLVARPLGLFVQAIELASPPVYLDAAEFAWNLNRNLEQLAPIYQRHARSFGLAEDAYPIYLPGTKIGPEGRDFVLKCLLAASACAPSRLDVREKIADLLEERGRFGEALPWRQGIEAADRAYPGNSPPAVDAGVLAREQARALLAEGKAGDALSKYAASLTSYHVTDVPMQYELVGNHKLVLHEQCYYVVPRDIQEFMISEGIVYRLAGIGRHSTRRLPPWLFALLFPCVSLLRRLKTKAREWRAGASVGAAMVAEYGQRTVRLASKIRPRLRRRVAARAVAPPCARRSSRPGSDRRMHAMEGQHHRLIQTAKAPIDHLRRMIFKIGWSRYAVLEVVTAPSREAALALIAKISNLPLAGDGAEPRVVRRRLIHTSALDRKPERVTDRPSILADD